MASFPRLWQVHTHTCMCVCVCVCMCVCVKMAWHGYSMIGNQRGKSVGFRRGPVCAFVFFNKATSFQLSSCYTGVNARMTSDESSGLCCLFCLRFFFFVVKNWSDVQGLSESSQTNSSLPHEEQQTQQKPESKAFDHEFLFLVRPDSISENAYGLCSLYNSKPET